MQAEKDTIIIDSKARNIRPLLCFMMYHIFHSAKNHREMLANVKANAKKKTLRVRMDHDNNPEHMEWAIGLAPSPGMIKMILPSYLQCCPVTQAAILRNKMVFGKSRTSKRYESVWHCGLKVLQ